MALRIDQEMQISSTKFVHQILTNSCLCMLIKKSQFQTLNLFLKCFTNSHLCILDVNNSQIDASAQIIKNLEKKFLLPFEWFCHVGRCWKLLVK